jgi:hypothetical protein
MRRRRKTPLLRPELIVVNDAAAERGAGTTPCQDMPLRLSDTLRTQLSVIGIDIVEMSSYMISSTQKYTSLSLLSFRCYFNGF